MKFSDCCCGLWLTHISHKFITQHQQSEAIECVCRQAAAHVSECCWRKKMRKNTTNEKEVEEWRERMLWVWKVKWGLKLDESKASLSYDSSWVIGNICLSFKKISLFRLRCSLSTMCTRCRPELFTWEASTKWLWLFGNCCPFALNTFSIMW